MSVSAVDTALGMRSPEMRRCMGMEDTGKWLRSKLPRDIQPSNIDLAMSSCLQVIHDGDSEDRFLFVEYKAHGFDMKERPGGILDLAATMGKGQLRLLKALSKAGTTLLVTEPAWPANPKGDWVFRDDDLLTFVPIRGVVRAAAVQRVSIGAWCVLLSRWVMGEPIEEFGEGS